MTNILLILKLFRYIFDEADNEIDRTAHAGKTECFD